MWNMNTVFETPGVGGAVACTAIVILVACYGLTIKWISNGRADETDTQLDAELDAE